jgi:hypothetical protein
MYDTLEARLTAAGLRTTKLQLAFDALEFADGNVSEAKRITAKQGLRIAARTWHKAITARLAHLQKQDQAYDQTREYDADLERYQAK